MSKTADQTRIEALEEALLEYVARYGPTELAKRAFRIGEGSMRDVGNAGTTDPGTDVPDAKSGE